MAVTFNIRISAHPKRSTKEEKKVSCDPQRARPKNICFHSLSKKVALESEKGKI